MSGRYPSIRPSNSSQLSRNTQSLTTIPEIASKLWTIGVASRSSRPRLLMGYTVRKHDIEASITLHGRVESKVLDIASHKIIDHIQNHFDEWHEIINNRYGMDKEVCFVYGTTTASSASLSVVHRGVGNSDSKYGFPFTQEAQPATPFIRVYMASKTEDRNPDHPLYSFVTDAFKFEYDPIQRSCNPVEDLIAYIQWRRDKERRNSLAIASYQDIMCIFEHGVPSNVSLTLWREDRDIHVNEHGVATIRLDQLTSPRSQSHMATFLGICIRKRAYWLKPLGSGGFLTLRRGVGGNENDMYFGVSARPEIFAQGE